MSKTSLTTIFLLSWIISFHSCFLYGNENPTLLFFTADWCRSCQIAKNDINTDAKLSEAIKSYDVVILDFDVDKEFVTGYNIKTIPTFIIFQNGEEQKRQVGYSGPSKFYKFLK